MRTGRRGRKDALCRLQARSQGQVSLAHNPPPPLLFTLSGTSPEPSLHSHPFLSTLGLHIPSPTLTHLNRTHGNLTPCIQVPVITSHTRQSSTCFSGHRIPASTRDGRPHLPSTPISPPSPPPSPHAPVRLSRMYAAETSRDRDVMTPINSLRSRRRSVPRGDWGHGTMPGARGLGLGPEQQRKGYGERIGAEANVRRDLGRPRPRPEPCWSRLPGVVSACAADRHRPEEERWALASGRVLCAAAVPAPRPEERGWRGWVWGEGDKTRLPPPLPPSQVAPLGQTCTV